MSESVRGDEGGSLAILAFELGSGLYALPMADVDELVRAVTVVPLPKAPAVVEGVVDVRGRVVPVFDLRARFAARGMFSQDIATNSVSTGRRRARALFRFSNKWRPSVRIWQDRYARRQLHPRGSNSPRRC